MMLILNGICQYEGKYAALNKILCFSFHSTEKFINRCNAAIWIFPKNALGDGPGVFARDLPIRIKMSFSWHHFENHSKVTSYPCQRKYTACDPNSPFRSNLPENAIGIDCKGPYCKPKCKQGHTPMDLRRFRCGQDHKWYVL